MLESISNELPKTKEEAENMLIDAGFISREVPSTHFFSEQNFGL